MPSVKYNYTISSTCPQGVNIDALSYEIRASAIVHALHYVYVDDADDRVDIWFRDALDSTDQATLVELLNNHPGMPLPFSTTISGTDSGFMRGMVINDQGETLGAINDRPFIVRSYNTPWPHDMNGPDHNGILDDSQIPDLITRDSELVNTSGILNTKIDNLDFYTTDEVDTIVSGLAAWDHDHDLRYIKINNQIVIDHGSISGLDGDDHPQYILHTEFTTYSGTLQNQIDGKAPTTHSHNDLYFTEAEITTISGNIISQIITDHGALSGRSDDDHTQYALATGARDITGQQTFQNNVVVQGNLVVSGTQFIANVETVQVEDNILLVNNGEPGAGVTERYAGIEIERGSSTNYLFVFDENTDNFQVGISGSLQPVATREESPLSSGIAVWNSTALRFDTITNSMHTRQHAVTSTVDHTAGNNKVFYSNNSGVITELPLGASGTILMSAGSNVAPTFDTGSNIFDYFLATSCVSIGSNFYTDPATTWIDVPLAIIQFQNNTDIVERNPSINDRITIKLAGVYLIQYCIPVYCPIVERVDMRFRINDATVISGSVSYLNDSMTQQVANQFSTYLNTNDFITLQTMGATTGGYLAGTGTINIVRLTASKGEKGDQGLPGVGSTVNVLNNDTVVSGSPFGNLNFKGFTAVSGTPTGTVNVQNVFGSYFQEASADVDDSTTAVWPGSPNNPRVRITTPDLPSGKYRIGWSYNIYGSSSTVSPQARVQINDTDTIHAWLVEPKDASTNEQDAVSGFYYMTSSGIKNIDLDYGSETAGSSVTIRRARLEFWRVS